MKEVMDQVQIRKSFAVAKDKLYSAWNEEHQLKQWWKPMGKQLVEVKNNLNEGGKISYRFEDDLAVEGEYKEVQEGERLVYSWNWNLPDDSHFNGEYLLTVLFSGDGNRSELEVKQEDFKQEHAVKPHREGWEQALEDLKQFLERK